MRTASSARVKVSERVVDGSYAGTVVVEDLSASFRVRSRRGALDVERVYCVKVSGGRLDPECPEYAPARQSLEQEVRRYLTENGLPEV